MNLSDFLRERVEIIEQDFLSKYNIQRDKEGKKFVYSPFITLDELIEDIENDIQDNPYDEEIIEDITREEERALLEELLEHTKMLYRDIAEKRKKFEI